MRTEHQDYIRSLYRQMKDAQETRLADSGRVGLKANGKPMANALTARVYTEEHKATLLGLRAESSRREKQVAKLLKEALEQEPIYQWLLGVGNIAERVAGAIVGEIDIAEADTASALWQYAGMNSAPVFGRKLIPQARYKPCMGEIKKEMPMRDGKLGYVVLTSRQIRGDKKVKGFLCPYNPALKMALLGNLGDLFINGRNAYTQYYYSRHIPAKYQTDPEAMAARPELAGRYGMLDVSEKLVQERRRKKPAAAAADGLDELEAEKETEAVMVMWKDASVDHRHRAAIRYMMKMFLKDLYVAWRTLAGLPVREPYSEGKLGHVHHGQGPAVAPPVAAPLPRKRRRAAVAA